MSWHEITLGDAIHVKHGFAFKSQYFSDSGEYLVLTPGNFNEEGGFRLRSGKDRFFVGDIPEDFVLDEGDLIVAMTEQGPGLLGSSALIPEGGKYLHNQRLGLIQDLNETILDKQFLYYLFNTRSVRGQISGSASGTKVRHTAPERIYRVKVTVPSEADEQKRIGAVLSAYDDLIENNRRRVELLEQAARLLYKEWFVHLRFPGHEHVTITDGVPEGWESVDLDSIISIKHGYAFKGEFFSEESTSRILLTPGNFKIGGGVKFDKLKHYSEEGPLSDEYVLQRDDLLVTMTDLSKSSDTLGYPLLVPELNGIAFLHNQRLGAVTPKDDVPFYRHFLNQLFRDSRYRSFVQGSASGTSVKHTSPKKILSYKPVLPPYEQSGLLRVFNDFAGSINAQCQKLLRANESLARARDLLLPRLMNGEIPV